MFPSTIKTLPGLLVTIFVSAAGTLLAQPVLTDTGINPSIGEVYTYNYSAYMSPGNAGPGQAWDLSAITVTSSSSYTLGAIVSAPSSAQFSATSNIQLNNGTTYNFLNISTAAYRNTGTIAGSTITIAHSDAEDVLRFPFNPNDNFSDAWAATFTLSNIAFTRNGTTNVTYDGSGSLALPSLMVSNAARLHVIQNYTDVSAFNTITYYNDEYLWFVNGHHQPIAGMFSFTVNGSPASQGGFYSVDASLVNGIRVQQDQLQFSCYPNPAANEIFFHANETAALKQVQLFDGMGTEVYFQNLERAETSLIISLGHLPAGIYTARVIGQSGAVGTQRICIVK